QYLSAAPELHRPARRVTAESPWATESSVHGLERTDIVVIAAQPTDRRRVEKGLYRRPGVIKGVSITQSKSRLIARVRKPDFACGAAEIEAAATVGCPLRKPSPAKPLGAWRRGALSCAKGISAAKSDL